MNQLRMGCVIILRGDTTTDEVRMWGKEKEMRCRRSLQENGHRQNKRERLGRSKITVTLSVDRTHYFSIQ